MTTGNLSSMCFVAKKNPSHFQSSLLALSYSPWKDMDANGFKGSYNAIRSSIRDPRVSQLFDLYLITKFLLDPNPPDWSGSWISNNIQVNQYLGIDFEQLKGSSWQRVPVLLTGNGNAHIRIFIAGCLTCGLSPDLVPGWAIPLFDSAALESARTALELVTGQDGTDKGCFIFYPLTLLNDHIQFKDRSASLSLALGFKSLLKEETISPRIICTGVIVADGTIGEVGGLGVKQGKFQEEDAFACLFYPVSNRVNNQQQDKLSLSVRTFDQAWMFASLYSDTHKDKLFLLSIILEEPKHFAAHLDSLPGEWISWINREKKAVNILSSIVKDSGLLNIFTKKFEFIVENALTADSTAIAELMTDTMVDQVVKTDPMSALRWCTSNLSLANHLGQVGQALKWKERGRALVDRVKQLEIELVVTFFNHGLVASHNRFEFTPDLPGSLEKTLDFLQDQYRCKCDFGCTIDLILGRLYGTLMQNYAFCGSGYIRESEIYAEKALKALGENLSSEYKAEWVRQYSYLTFARLDAGDFKGAEKSLKQYLETDRLETIFDYPYKLSCWQLALACRFFAQVKDHPLRQPIYKYMISTIKPLIENGHPWQLCTYNLGQIALDSGDKTNAEYLLKKSLEICLSKTSGPTIHAMALLPLSLLSALYEETGKGNLDTIINHQEQKNIVSASEQLDGSHFAFLQACSFKNALGKIRKHPETVFPFSYR